MPHRRPAQTWRVLALFLLFLLGGAAFLIQAQLERDVEAARAAGERQLNLLASLVKADLQLGNYQQATAYLRDWGNNHLDVASLRLESSDGFLLGEYVRATPAQAPREMSADIQYGYSGAARLRMAVDVSHLKTQAWATGLQLGIAYLFLAGMLIALNRALILRGRERDALERRSAELDRANAELTETVQQLEASQREGARLVSILEATTDLVSMADPQANVIYMNRAGRALLGLGDRDLADFRIPQVHPEWATQRILDEGIPSAIRTGSWSGETAVLTGDGRQIPTSQVILCHRDDQGEVEYLSTVIRDISERKAAEAKLRASETQLEKAQAIAHIGSWDLDLVSGKANWSKEEYRLLGYSPEATEASAEHFLARVHPDDRDRVWAEMQAAMTRPDGAYVIEHRVLLPDGGEHILLQQGYVTFDNEGKPLHMLGTSLDVTLLRQSERRLIEAQRIAHIGSWELDLTHNQLTWSGEIFRIFEIDAERFPASYDAFLEAVHPDDRQQVNQAYSDSVRDRHPYDITHRLRMPDGRIKYVRERCETQYDAGGKPLRSLGTVQDVTELQEAEQQLRAYQEELETLVAERTSQVRDQATIIDQIHDAVVSTTLEGYITGWNRGAEQLFGYSQAEAIGQHIGMVYFDADRLQQRVVEPLLEKGAHEVELPMRRKDGTPFDAHLSLSMRYDDQGRAYGMIGYSQDISERKQAERLLALRSDELEATNKELEAFSYSVSHDLRAPLRAIDGFSQAILEDYGDRFDDTGRNYLARVRAATQRMGVLIDDLLKLSRVTRAPMQPARLDLSRMAGEILAQLGEESPERQVEAVIQPHLQAWGDPGLLHAALENLLANAWKYTARQGQARIEVGSETDAGEMVFFVRDNGAGFDMRYADKLFGAFQRLHHPDEFSGTGVGLATVQRIIHRHGGRIWAESAPGEGATFRFTLPAAEAETAS